MKSGKPLKIRVAVTTGKGNYGVYYNTDLVLYNGPDEMVLWSKPSLYGVYLVRVV